MSDDTNSPGPPAGPSWTPPPSGSSTPPAPPQQHFQSFQGGPAPDPTGGVPQPQPKQQSARRLGSNISLSAPLIFGIVAVAAIILATFVEETEINFWDQFGGLWSLFAIAAAILTLLPTLRSVFNMRADLAWKLAVGGAAALVLWWVLFVLPHIGRPEVSNLTFLATVGVAAGVLAVWTSPQNALRSRSDSSKTL